MSASTPPNGNSLVLIRIIIAAMAFLATAAASAADLSGPVQAIDGDSLYISGREVRLQGIDAPEWGQPCALPNGETWMAGQEAAAWMASILAGKAVACRQEKQDRYGRTLATCYLDGININELAVRQGWAMAYRRYSDRYVPAEDEARQAGRGLWRAKCAAPEQWRHDKDAR